MQIVIDIPEKEYKRWQDEGEMDALIVRNSLVNGTPLPKGHGRLIDADELDVGAVFDDYGNRQGYKYVGEYELNNAPTIIEADEESEDDVPVPGQRDVK